ncbi:hypothetical protein BC941DRAFT_430588 [Chlamydoabsidia padenii]|nr:hypothetical protein BC941DRAFT_430588 [Chlamydoabsidia padenii]
MSVQEQSLCEKQSTTVNIPSPPASDNEHDFSLTDLLQPTMTPEQIKIIELALAKIKSKRDALLLNEQEGGGTILSYDWAMVAKQMAKALTTTCNKQSFNKTPSSSTTCTSLSSPNAINSNSLSTQGSTTTCNTAMTTTTKPPIPVSAVTTPPASPPQTQQPDLITDRPTCIEPMVETKDGVEWVSFVYSHHRVIRRYRIRTDLDTVDVNTLEEQFKNNNCVYPRANIPREAYQGNRWCYETECNMLGWKLAYLNMDEIAGKRGLIQRAVDSYRNRYPSMRSRRVARQEKLLKGTLRKRKQSPCFGEDVDDPSSYPCKSPKATCGSSASSSLLSGNITINDDSNTLSASATCHSATKATITCGKIPKLYPSHEKTKALPKTLTIDDRGTKCRLRINIDSVDLTVIDQVFRKNNCVFPRAMDLPSSSNITQRRQDEAKCNEIGWKLAWLNTKHLANKKNFLQRVLDIYRDKFTPHLAPRQSPRTPRSHALLESKPTPLTTEALAAHHQQQEQLAAKNGLNQGISNKVRYVCKKKDGDNDDSSTVYTGSTDSLDFMDCFSPPPETTTTMDDLSLYNDPILVPTLTNDLSDFNNSMNVPPPPPPMVSDEYFESILDPLASPRPLSATLTSDLIDDTSCHLSVDSCHNSPPYGYATLSDDTTYTDPLLVMPDDLLNSEAKTVLSSPTPSKLPTDIFAAQDMDWTPDVEECILADLHSDVLVHQLFLA